MLFVDAAAVAAHTQEELRTDKNRFSEPCRDIGLTISLKKKNVLGQVVDASPITTIDDYEPEVLNQFTYLGSKISKDLTLDTGIDKRIGNAETTHPRLITRVWENSKLHVKTKSFGAKKQPCLTPLK